MNIRLNLLLLLLTVAPLVALGLLGEKMAQEAEVEVSQQFKRLELNRLEALRARIDALIEARARALVKLTNDLPTDVAALRKFVRRTPEIGQIMILDDRGRRVFPPLDGPLSEWERRFLERTRGLWEGRALGPTPSNDLVGNDSLSNIVVPQTIQAHGWQPWFTGGGMALIFWRQITTPMGTRTLGIEIPGAALLSELVAALPETEVIERRARTRGGSGVPEVGASAVRTALLEAGGEVLYQWGDYEPDKAADPLAELALPAPLGAWRLVSWTEPPPAGEDDFARWAAIAAVALALIGLAVLFHRESNRTITLAAQRVTFVNQVSHELKTPLTNIRMYAELLGESLEDIFDEDPRAARYMGVIVDESQRLSRMISNVLSFARDQRQQLVLKPRAICVDEVVRAAVEHFRPALEDKQITIEIDAHAGAQVMADVDVIEQVVGNLLSNVEKYGAKSVKIITGQGEGRTWVMVADQGAGIPAQSRERIFDPFYRLDDRLTAQASGTGIGLTISRRLARLHGGDLVLLDGAVDTHTGACFELTLHTPATEES
ncbi:MAG: sensor histidine kinase [Bradymonadia bacterium]